MRPARLCVRKNWKPLSLLRGATPATPGGRSILGEYGAHMGSGFQQKIFHMGSKIGNSGRYTRGRPVDPHYYYTTLGRTCQVVILYKKKEALSLFFSNRSQGGQYRPLPHRIHRGQAMGYRGQNDKRENLHPRPATSSRNCHRTSFSRPPNLQQYSSNICSASSEDKPHS